MSHPHLLLQIGAAVIAAMMVAFLAGFIFRDWLSRYALYRLRRRDCAECGLTKEQHDDPKQFRPRA